jgi:hypothetical protein
MISDCEKAKGKGHGVWLEVQEALRLRLEAEDSLKMTKISKVNPTIAKCLAEFVLRF